MIKQITRFTKWNVIIILSILAFPVFSQNKEEEKENIPAVAAKQFDAKNYKAALRRYSDLVKQDAQNPEYNLRTGICYLRTHSIKKEGLPYLQKYFSLPGADPKYLLDLGLAYHHAEKFDSAIAVYKRYLPQVEGKEKEQETVNMYIGWSENAKVITKTPARIKFENLGKKVNSEFADYYPFVPLNESIIVFTTRRKGNTGGVIDLDGYYSSEMFYSEWKNNSWTKAKSIGVKLNTDYDEEAVGLSQDGKDLIVYIDHEDTYSDLYISPYGKSGFEQAIELGKNINTNKLETAGSVGNGGNTVVFASERNDEDKRKGISDLWMCKKLPDGKWGDPIYLEDLNTIYGEDFPQLSDDGKSLIFASQGYTSIGGYDLFKSEWDESAQKWGTPVNLGYPINTTDDDMTISYMGNGRSAYISGVKEDGLGDYDIYRAVFEDIPPYMSVVEGKIVAEGDTGMVSKNASITVNYVPALQKQGDYRIIKGMTYIALDAGKYEVNIKCKGFKDFKKEIFVDNRKGFTEMVPMTFALEPDGTAVPAKDKQGKKDDKKKEKSKTGEPAADPKTKGKEKSGTTPKK